MFISTVCSNFKAHGKIPPGFMRSKSETSDFKLLVSSKDILYFRKYGADEKVSTIDSKIVQLQKSGTVQYCSQEGYLRPQHYIIHRVLENSIGKG